MKKEKVLLFFPKTGWDLTPTIHQPLSLLVIAASLMKRGFQTEIIDERIEPAWVERLGTLLKRGDIIAVGVSSMTGYQIKGGLEASRIVKEIDHQTQVIWGGVHPTLKPDETLAAHLIDRIVICEGDRSFANLIDALGDGKDPATVKGTGYKDQNNEVRINPEEERTPLEELPDPAYELLPLDLYRPTLFGSPPRSLAAITSRGCPHRCAYCYNLAFDKRRWRGMKAEAAVDMFRRVGDKFGVRDFFLLDDEFFVDPGRVREMCTMIIREGSPFRFHNANLRVSNVIAMGPEMLKLVKEAGFEKPFIGVESGSNRVLEDLGKGHDVAQVMEANRLLKEAGIAPSYSFLAGVPKETLEEVKETLKLMLRLHEDNPAAMVLNLSIYTPFPGTGLYAEALASGFREPRELNEWIPVSYEKTKLPSIDPVHSRFLDDAHYFTAFLDPKCLASIGKATLRTKIYGAVIRKRIKAGLFSYMPELKLREIMRKFANSGKTN